VQVNVARPAPAPTVGKTGRARRGASGSSARLALLLLLPAALVVFGVVLYPAGRALVISFYDVDSPFPGAYPFKGLGNYVDVLSDPRVLTAAGHTLYFTVASTAAELVLGIALALLLAAPLRFRWLFRSVVILPWARCGGSSSTPSTASPTPSSPSSGCRTGTGRGWAATRSWR
jgi:multiple sugar transport system permease protein/N,N'-diacetylchitobiose transport system permease protein